MNSKTTVTGDAKQVIGILAWTQAAGLQVSAVTVGACHVELHRVGAEREDAAEDQRPERSVYDQFGGPALAHVVSEIPAGELQPAIGRGGR